MGQLLKTKIKGSRSKKLNHTNQIQNTLLQKSKPQLSQEETVTVKSTEILVLPGQHILPPQKHHHGESNFNHFVFFFGELEI